MVLLEEEAWRLLSVVLDNRLPPTKVLVPEESSTDNCLGIEFAVPGVMQGENILVYFLGHRGVYRRQVAEDEMSPPSELVGPRWPASKKRAL